MSQKKSTSSQGRTVCQKDMGTTSPLRFPDLDNHNKVFLFPLHSELFRLLGILRISVETHVTISGSASRSAETQENSLARWGSICPLR
jgi:hypothetical protein